MAEVVELPTQIEEQYELSELGSRTRYDLLAELEPDEEPIVVVANALPAKPVPTKFGPSGEVLEWEFQKGDGGLVTALGSQYGIWIGAIRDKQTQEIMEAEGFAEANRMHKGSAKNGFQLEGVALSEYELKHYYNGYANQRMWPLLHGSLSEVVINNEDWTVYKRVSQKFADKIISEAPQNARAIINDYHQMLTAEMVRKRRPDLKLIYFLHVPFPDSKVFSTISYGEQRDLVRGMLANNIVGFHTEEYARNFVANVERLFGDKVKIIRNPNGTLEIKYKGRRIKIGVYPISIDADAFEKAGEKEEVLKKAEELRKEYAPHGEKLIFDVGRLDPIKGFPEGLKNIRVLLKKHPEMRGRFKLVEVAHDSRLDVPLYQELKTQTEALVREINNEFAIRDEETGQVIWEPIVHISKKLEQDGELLAWYKAADILRVTPLIDGMNLIAKEWFMVGKDDAIQILSKKAGAHKELNDIVLGVNPLDEDEVVEALRKAILPEEEGGIPYALRVEWKKTGRQRIRYYNVHRWMRKILADAKAA